MGEQRFVIRSKIWIADEKGNVVFGEGRYRILEAVDRLRSLQGAAKELKMSYRLSGEGSKPLKNGLDMPLLHGKERDRA